MERGEMILRSFFDGLYPPVQMPNWFLLLTLEILTIVIEWYVCYEWGKHFYMGKDGSVFSPSDALIMSVLMNVASVVVWLLVWLSIFGGF